MKPDIPSHPCPAPAAAKACFSSHKRCTIERLSLSLFHSPSFFYSSLVLVLPVGTARCQPLPKAGQSALTLYANASPLAQLTHAFGAPHQHLLLHFLIFFFYLLLCNPLSLSHVSLSSTPYCSCTSATPPSAFCCFTFSLLPVASAFYLNCDPFSSISLPLSLHRLPPFTA